MAEMQLDDAPYHDGVHSPEEWELRQERDREHKHLQDMLLSDWPETLPGKTV